MNSFEVLLWFVKQNKGVLYVIYRLSSKDRISIIYRNPNVVTHTLTHTHANVDSRLQISQPTYNWGSWQNFWQPIVFCAMIYLSSVITDFFVGKIENKCFINITWKQERWCLKHCKINDGILRSVLWFVCVCVCVVQRRKAFCDPTEKFMCKKLNSCLKRRNVTSRRQKKKCWKVRLC